MSGVAADLLDKRLKFREMLQCDIDNT